MHKGKSTPIYHITDIANLPYIINDGRLFSDAQMVERQSGHTVIGYADIKRRRLQQIQIPHSGRYVGEYVPFYFCPRSPMLYTINNGNTGREVGCQSSILHLVSKIACALGNTDDWAISDGNAGTFFTSFYHDLSALDDLNWHAIRASYWPAVRDAKMAEFLAADQFPWSNIIDIACYNEQVKNQVECILSIAQHKPVVKVMPSWYY